jgi:lipopolysaccharide export system permease protein
VDRPTRYIARQIAGALAFVTLALCGVVWLSQSLRFVDLIVNKGLSVGAFLTLTLLLLPTFLALILPIALFCAVLYVYARLMADREVVALRSAGLGPAALARPMLVAALGVTALLYGVMLVLMPAGYRAFKDRQFLVRADLTGVLLQQGTFTDLAEGLTVYVRDVAASGALLGILVHDERETEHPVTMMAEKGELIATAEGPRLVLEVGNRQGMDAGGVNLSLLYFDRYVLDLEAFAAPGSERWREPRERYLHELLGPPRREEDVTNAPELRAEAHMRLTAPWGALALGSIALAAALAGEFSRRGGGTRVLIAVGLGIAFEAATLVLDRVIIAAPALVPLLYGLYVLVPAGAFYALARARWPWRAAPLNA